MAKIRRFGFLALLLLVLLAMPFILVDGHTTDFKKGFTLNLQPPSFVQEAQAGNSAIGQYLDSEAGISAYYQSSSPIDLNQAKTAFRTIETQTSDYIIGSVSVPNYEELYDVHVYVHKSGWILAYYFNNDPVSKIIDVRAQSINSTKLVTVLADVASAARVSFTSASYYDFRYPNATNLLFIAEDNQNGNTFTVQAPSTYGYYELSWALLGAYWPNYFQLDGQNLNGVDNCYGTCLGVISASQFLPGVTHTIKVDDYGVLVIEYRVQ